jgi:oligosaccharyltransferase complex subunit delta (ribophorin II)
MLNRMLLQIVLDDSVDKKVYATGGRTQVPIFVTGVVKIDNAEIAIVDSDLGSIEAQKKYATSSNDFLLFSAD